MKNHIHVAQLMEKQEQSVKELREIIAAQAARIEQLEAQMVRTANVEEMTALVAAAVSDE